MMLCQQQHTPGASTVAGQAAGDEPAAAAPLVQVLQRLESVVNNLYAVGEWTDRTEDRPSSKVKVGQLLCRWQLAGLHVRELKLQGSKAASWCSAVHLQRGTP